MRPRPLALALILMHAPLAMAQGNAQSAPQAPPAAAQCSGCHGANGEGNAAGGYPRIAGQSQYYLAKQLNDYAQGRRRNAVMEPIAKSLQTADRSAVAEYFSRLVPAAAASASASTAGNTNANTKGAADNSTGSRARVLAVIGDGRRRVQACNNCHDPDGSGEPPTFPYLAGLDAKYLESALNEWRSGARNNDDTRQMAMIAKALAVEDIPLLAAYFAGLKPPAPLIATINAPSKSGGSGSGAGVVTQGQSGQAAGTEQGSPTQGGSQGPGGSGDSRNGDKAKR